MVLGGNLNFTLLARQAWGSKVRLDPLGNYFQDLLKENKLIDIKPLDLRPTWRNGRMG